MKNFIPKIIVIMFFVTTITGHNHTPAIFLHNNYGASIIYKKGSEGEKIIGNSARIKLFNNTNEVTHVSIRTNKSMSSFTGITPLLQEIYRQVHNHPTEDAIVYINPSSIYQNWDIITVWEKATNKDTEIITFDVWPTTTAKQIEYIHGQPWSKEVKIYILQLVWWSLERLLPTIDKKNQAKRKEIVTQTLEVIRALKVYNATAPGIQHNPGKKPKPLLTYKNVQLPADIDKYLKTFINEQLNSIQ